MRLALVAVLAGLFAMGCGGADSPVEQREGGRQGAGGQAPPADLPEHTVAAEQDTTQDGQSVKTYAVFTDATSGEDFRALTLFFRSENPDVDAVVVSFSDKTEL